MIYCGRDPKGDPQNMTLASSVRICFKKYTWVVKPITFKTTLQFWLFNCSVL